MGAMDRQRDAVLRPQERASVLRRARDAWACLLRSSLAWLVLARWTSAHPRCLDFEPPFKPQWHLEFCRQYEQFGCCDQRADNAIAEAYWDVMDQLEAAGHELCEDTLKEVT